LLHQPGRTDVFSFVLLSDRTGMAQPGVFERAVEITNLLRPQFAIQIGDTIEGYTLDPATLQRQWEEIDEITDRLEVPLVRVPGNHDVSNEFMRWAWLNRNGPLHHHFRHRDVLFLALDTQDPPQSLLDMLRPGTGATSELPPPVAEVFTDEKLDDQERTDRVLQLLRDDPWVMRDLMMAIKDSTQPANVSDAQLDELTEAIADNDDVRWTVLLMHIPMWQGDGHPALDRLRAALGSRPYTAFAGHCHNYRRSTQGGRDHIRLGSTGGIRIMDAPDGNFDHLSWVTMTASGPRVANVLLDGILDADGRAVTATDIEAPAVQ
jgi:3',5'-cyclic AMP phosphodiesterase CpdA